MAPDQPSFSAPFPPSAQKLIMDYHRAHSNSLRFALCVGHQGATSTTTFLADFFQHIHVSVSEHDKLLDTRKRLSSFYAENWWKAKFSFSHNTAERLNLAVARGSVDMCFLMAPFGGRIWKVVDKVAETLAPNGTMVIVSTAMIPRVVGGDERVREAVKKMYEPWGWVLQAGKEEKHTVKEWNSPLDFVPLRHEEGDSVWIQDVTKRIKIWFPEVENDDCFVIPGTDGGVAESRVGPKQRKYWFTADDEEGKGWRDEVDIDWFQRHLVWLEDDEDLSEYEVMLGEVERLIGETTKDGKVTIEWPAAILLATKK